MFFKNDKFLNLFKLILKNALDFLFNLFFIFVFQLFFGTSNILVGVAISVGFIMIPYCDLNIKPITMFFIIIGLYLGGGIIGQFALLSPFLALPVYFLFVFIIMGLTCEPIAMKPSISFLLCFIFSQATPVSIDEFPKRMIGILAGGFLVSVWTLINWRKKGYGIDGRNLKQQFLSCINNKSFIFRMSIGVALAMFMGMVLNLKKPLWISIVVMSLTQMEFSETFERIKHRSIATVFGSVLFIFIFGFLVPQKYAYLFILLIGYLNFFTKEYKHKQIVNAISAINASLVILNTTDAIISRFLCLVGGISIVLIMWGIQKLVKKLHYNLYDYLSVYFKKFKQINL